MRRTLWMFLAVGLTAQLLACGSQDRQEPPSLPEEDSNNNGDDLPEVQGPSWYADVEPILAEKCNNCHVEGGVAPFSFSTYDEAFATRAAIKTSVMNRTMPPWGATQDCNNYQHDQSLSQTQLDTLVQWVDTGARQGDLSEAPTESSAPPEIETPRVDLTLSLPEPYQPKSSPDDYRCFVVDWPAEEVKYVTGFHVRPGNARVAHHVIGFLATPDRVSEFEQLDAEEPGPGYTCFGGPGGEDDLGTRWVGAWAPGAVNPGFPEGTGIRVEPGSKIILQVHYNTLNGDGEADLTEMDFRLADSVEKEALLMPYANPSWVLSGSMPIPAGMANASHEYVNDFTEFLPFLTDGRMTGDRYLIHNASLHMHSVGQRGVIEYLKGGDDDDSTCMLDVPQWDFDWQRTYGFEEPILFEKGDKLSLRCFWDNSQENQPYGMVDTDDDGVPDTYQQLPTQDRNWGDGTTDEMCLGIFYITEP